MTPPDILTIGHSTLEPARVLELLTCYEVQAVADVRSSPYSQRTPAFNREPLSAILRSAGMSYVFLGSELGGRNDDPAFVGRGGRVDYEKMSQTPEFSDGLARLVEGAERLRVALLCSEHEPLSCHRGLLVSRALTRQGIEVAHIHRDASLENHRAAEARLLELTGLEPFDLFRSEDEVLDEAYALRASKVAYAPGLAEGESA